MWRTLALVGSCSKSPVQVNSMLMTCQRKPLLLHMVMKTLCLSYHTTPLAAVKRDGGDIDRQPEQFDSRLWSCWKLEPAARTQAVSVHCGVKASIDELDSSLARLRSAALWGHFRDILLPALALFILTVNGPQSWDIRNLFLKSVCYESNWQMHWLIWMSVWK